MDPSFGTDGVAVYSHDGTTAYAPFLDEWAGQAKALAIDRQGRILIGGGSGASMLVLRYLPNGVLDDSFGEGGVLSFYDYLTTGSGSEKPDHSAPRVKAILPKADGSIVVVAQSFGLNGGNLPWDMLYWFTEDGHEDSSVGLPHAGKVGDLPESLPRSAVFDGSGNILIAGQRVTESDDWGNASRYDGYLMKRDPMGEPDPLFGGGVFRYSKTTPEPGIRGLSGAGFPPYSAYSGVKVLKTGKILAGGHRNDRLILTRLTSNGKFDRTFGPWRGKFKKRNRGSTIANFGGKKCRCANNGDIATDQRGRIYQVGTSSYPYKDKIATIVVVRYLHNGAIDRTFGKRGFSWFVKKPWMRSTAIAVQRNGRVVVTGRYGPDSKPKFLIARLLPSGKLDKSFFGTGIQVQRFGDASAAEKVLVDQQGRIVVAGGFSQSGKGNFLLERILP